MQKQLVVYGSGRHRIPFLKYIATITGKERPQFCFIPTASGDNQDYIISFYEACKELKITPHVLKVWVNSYDNKETFASIIDRMDAIIVGGGNTLNMLAIWKAQGIDVQLKKAYDKGCVMAGGSAGSLCWFNGGTTDSRPGELSIVAGMGFINKSHCPHYNSESSRRPLYHSNILDGKLTEGYACDDASGIHFINGEVHQAVSIDTENKSFFVYQKENQIVEEELTSIFLD